MKLNFNPAKPKRAVLALVCALLACTGAFSQEERITLSNLRLTGEQIFAEIEAGTRYKFFYDKSVYDGAQSVELSKTNGPVKEILNKMFEGKPVEYRLHGNMIFLGPRPAPAANRVSRPDRTSDRYTPNALGAVSVASRARPEPEPMPEAQVVEAKIQERVFPESYSDYHDIREYGRNTRHLPGFAVKTNLLYYAALTPNLSFEFGLNERSTLAFSGSYSWFGREKDQVEDYKQFVHSVFMGEYRYWLCERFNGHFIGGHLLYGVYNTSGYKIPMLFDKGSRYEGKAYGIGITYGYSLPLAKRWSLEFTVGLGYMYMDYDKFDCATCATDTGIAKTKNYFGPTKLGLNLVFLIK